MYVIHSVQYNQ